MHTFKEHLTESIKNVAWLSKELEFVFGANEGAWGVEINIPLSSPSLQRIFKKKITKTAIHITNKKGFEKLEAIQGSKKAISTTLAPGRNTILRYGIQGGGGILVKVKGNVLADFNTDAMSKPDGQGRRWIPIAKHTFSTNASEVSDVEENWKFIDKFTDEFLNLEISVFEKLFLKYENLMTSQVSRLKMLVIRETLKELKKKSLGQSTAGKAIIQGLGQIDNPEDVKLIQKLKSELIRGHMGMIEKQLKKHSAEFEEMIFGSASRITVEGEYTELLLNEFKIVEILVIDPAGTSFVKKYKTKYSIKYVPYNDENVKSYAYAYAIKEFFNNIK